MAFETEFVAGGKDTYAVISDMAGNDYGITFSYVARQEFVIAVESSYSSRVDKYAVAFAVFYDFGVSGNDIYAGRRWPFPRRFLLNRRAEDLLPK